MLALARAGGAAATFTVDDAWIHLTYARSLARFGTFAYFPGDPVTAGSTAPLFTLLEAAAFRLTSDEHLIGYGLGLLAHAAFLLALARWAARRFGHPGWAAFVVALVVADGRFGILAVSGMETSLFMALIALAFAAWSEDDALAVGLALGAAVWTRPEALLLAGVFALDALLARHRPRRLAPGLASLAAVLIGYLAFNRLTGGAFFPGSMAAKSAFYFFRTSRQYLVEDVGATFAGGWLLLAPFALFAAWSEARTLFVRSARALRPEVGWAIALPLAFGLVLPFSQRFNRYLLPVLPAYAMVAVTGLRGALDRSTRTRSWAAVWTVAACAVVLSLHAFYFESSFSQYVLFARYHVTRHVRAALWLAAHTPEDAVIATHDVGAIGFYSHRHIVDMTGLITPEVVPHLRKADYLPYLEDLFAKRHVGYIAVLEDWYLVDNVRPLFVPDPNPEVLDVYAWKPGVSHLVDSKVQNAEIHALNAIQGGRFDAALALVRETLAKDDRAATVWYLYGAALDRSGHPAEAEAPFRRALALFPESSEAHFGLAGVLIELGRAPEARAQLDSLRLVEPRHPGIAWLEERLAKSR